MVHRNNTRRKKTDGNLGETIRVASIVQKGVNTGRSSRVEMDTISRIASQNIRKKVNGLSTKGGRLSETLADILSATSKGYLGVLAPNGRIQKEKFDALMAIDDEIVRCLEILESEISSGKTTDESVQALQNLVKQRKEIED
ncbi:MAG: hypothetical protein DA330_07750 [Nitrososphaera sp.]|nr:hypothetical protein [Nitrososphaera sp.]